MRLTVYTDFSLRVLMYVALHPERLPTIGEIAAAHGISKNHLMKVVHQLGAAGYVETVRGKRGGLRLARPAGEIRIGDVVRHAEPDMAMAPCFEGAEGLCRIAPACRLRSALHQATAAFLGVLDGYTLADVVGNREALGRLLDGPRPLPAG
jgi:Rrf2 family nitric oxide-sensitive transcriptional repressor